MQLKQSILTILILLTIVYVSIGFLIFLFQKALIYYPNNQDFNNCEGFKDYEKIDYQGTRFYYKENSGNLIIYYHGNAGSACDRSFNKELFEEKNNSVLYVEYAGYSNQDTQPSYQNILKDVETVNLFINSKSFDKVIVYGESIGSGPASYHASIGEVSGLILVTPFNNLKDVAQSKYIIYPASIILTEKYDNSKWLESFDGRLLIIHGNKDYVVPNKFSEKLFAEVETKSKEYVLIDGNGHNDIWNSPEMQQKILEFIS